MSKDRFTFFYTKQSPLSQFYPCKFVVDGQEFNCAEQYMMYQKAVVFGDDEMAARILATDSPGQQKACGRRVRNYVEAVWAARSTQVVTEGNRAKFSQNPELRAFLLSTAGTILAEASPGDRKWGIGLRADHPDARHVSRWRGTNLLGKCLMTVRDELVREQEQGK